MASTDAPFRHTQDWSVRHSVDLDIESVAYLPSVSSCGWPLAPRSSQELSAHRARYDHRSCRQTPWSSTPCWETDQSHYGRSNLRNREERPITLWKANLRNREDRPVTLWKANLRNREDRPVTLWKANLRNREERSVTLWKANLRNREERPITLWKANLRNREERPVTLWKANLRNREERPDRYGRRT